MNSNKKNDISEKKYVAYVASYTSGNGDKFGIRIYDVDAVNGRMKEKEKVSITNSSYITESHNKKYIYSITDFGVEAYKSDDNGKLLFLNEASINGMRGCYLSTDYDDRFLFCAGHHDGKITVLRLNDDGTIGEITDEIYEKGLGIAGGRNHVPHVQCVKMTRDNKFLCAADLGMDRVTIYLLNHDTGKLMPEDIIHCDQDSAPRHLKFSDDGRFMYIIHEQKNTIEVYSYTVNGNLPEFEKIQTITTANTSDTRGIASSAMNFSNDSRYMIASTMGENDVDIFDVDKESGMLTKILGLPIAGDYPKDVAFFPDCKHLVSLNHESNSMTFFTVNLDKKIIVMNGPEIKVEQPNCIVIHEISK